MKNNKSINDITLFRYLNVGTTIFYVNVLILKQKLSQNKK